jgi:hypothetical protein
MSRLLGTDGGRRSRCRHAGDLFGGHRLGRSHASLSGMKSVRHPDGAAARAGGYQRPFMGMTESDRSPAMV